MLTGQRSPTSVFVRIVEALHLAIHAYPFLVIGGGLTLVGLLAIGPRKDIRDLWICLPAGLALLGVFAGLSYWLWWRLPRLTVTRFAFDESELAMESPARGSFTVPVRDLRLPYESRGRRKVLGWWLRFETFGSVFLDASTPNAAQLVQEIQGAVKRQQGNDTEHN